MTSTRSTFDRDAYFHRVQVTQAIASALEGEITAYSEETWHIEFTDRFWFRLIDRTHTEAGITRDYGWYDSLDEVGKKIKAIFPTIQLKALTV